MMKCQITTYIPTKIFKRKSSYPLSREKLSKIEKGGRGQTSRLEPEQDQLEDTNKMKVACILLLTLVLVFLIEDSEAWRPKEVYDRYKSKKMQATLSGQHTCVADDVCGISCIKNECMWYCDNICNIMTGDKFNWRGDLVTLPCKFSAYDYTGVGYFYPADLAFHVKERGRENDNMMVFKRLDQNSDGRVSASDSEIIGKEKHARYIYNNFDSS
ncbi:unnamed protein product [Mytilus coruscus]|uniref:Uncharacterized protein n=1 Tax=Mytilus coruscus TaxID=42192 RepID=A0A6J8E0H1_MYTCO|nr:unnamed protein product [Mytilus coruscus]